MKERILTGWTFARGLYFIIGILVIIESIMSKQWFGVALGGYFSAMGLFAFACASGNCYDRSCSTELKQKLNTTIQDVEFEEIKTK